MICIVRQQLGFVFFLGRIQNRVYSCGKSVFLEWRFQIQFFREGSNTDPVYLDPDTQLCLGKGKSVRSFKVLLTTGKTVRWAGYSIFQIYGRRCFMTWTSTTQTFPFNLWLESRNNFFLLNKVIPLFNYFCQ